MFSIDDRAGNVVTTVALFLLGATILYVARGAFLILVLALLFAYLLEPAVAAVQQHSPLGQKNRTWAIAQVYLVGALLLGGLGWQLGPHLIAQVKGLNAALPETLQNISGERISGELQPKHGLSAAQQQKVRDWLARNHDSIARVFERGAESAAYVAARAVWLFAIPVLAIFILRDGRSMMDATIRALAGKSHDARVERTLLRVDGLLAKYVRAQLALAGLSSVFYSVSMLALGFPYAVAAGALGGVLEFLPAVGWVASAAAILTIGFLAHAHWIWMSVLLLVWRLVPDYVNSPRLMGDNLELQPLTVVFALMVGGQLGGIAGLYLSVPAVAVLRIVWLECFPSENSSIALSNETLTPAKALN